MLTLERITTPSHPLYQEALALYHISFPPHEQRENASQTAILAHPAYHFEVVLNDATFVGEVLYWEIGGFLYIEHFCILPQMRNRHYGQKVLELLQTKPLILEIDPPVTDIAERRKGFYERCGFVANPYPHVHPPYHKSNHGHDLVIMSCPRMLTQSEYDKFFVYLKDTVMHRVYE